VLHQETGRKVRSLAHTAAGPDLGLAYVNQQRVGALERAAKDPVNLDNVRSSAMTSPTWHGSPQFAKAT
jgi:hypothetical protein